MSEDTRNHPAVVGTIEALGRCVQAVDAIDDEQFAQRPAGHDSIGAHLRHCIEYVQCLLAGIEPDTIEYDARPRNRELEQSRSACRHALEDLKDRIQSIPPDLLEKEVHPKETLSLTCGSRATASNVLRELGYLSQHTIHHLAIIALIADLGGFSVPRELGLACSTAVYRTSLESGS